MKRYSLVGLDGNAFAIIGYVTKALQDINVEREVIDAYIKKAKEGNYRQLIIESYEQLEFVNEQIAERNCIYDDDDEDWDDEEDY